MKDYKILNVKNNMQDYKINYNKKEMHKENNVNKRLKMLWIHLLFQLLKIKNIKFNYKIKKWWNILKINKEKIDKINKEEEIKIKLKKWEWDNI